MLIKNAPELAKQLKNRLQIDENLSRVEVIIRDYFRILPQLIFDAKKENERELDALRGLLSVYAALDENTIDVERKEIINKRSVRFARREIDCIKRIMEGKSASEIGNCLGISERTVDFYIVNGIKKLVALNSLAPRRDNECF